MGVIDGIVNGVGRGTARARRRSLRYLQLGFVRCYAAIILLGALAVVGYFAYNALAARAARTVNVYAAIPAHDSDPAARSSARLPSPRTALAPYSAEGALPLDRARASRSSPSRLSLLLLTEPVELGRGGAFHFVQNVPWIESIGAHYHVGVDGISLWLVLLTTLLMPISILSSWTSVEKRPLAFFAFMLLLESRR